MKTIGVDIGGTNTDAVLIDEQGTILYCVKTSTTKEIDEGFSLAISSLMQMSGVAKEEIKNVYVGTTHATNAILEKNDLFKVGLIRIAGHQPETLPPCFGWPDELRNTLFVGCETIAGGYECDGSAITPFSEEDARNAILRLKAKGAESLAVVGTFSPIIPDQELLVEKIAEGLIPVSLSHEIGSIGCIERENTTLLNAGLKKSLAQGFKRLQETLTKLGLHAPLFLTQNNGTIIELEKALRYPVMTISAGPTNSFIGATKLLGLSHAIVVDIGGTSTDVGIVVNNFPRRSLHRSKIGGVSLNFSMPDVLCVALGGGSYVSANKETVGPKSCGRRLKEEAFCFGGKTLTLTDLAACLDEELIPGIQRDQIPCTREEALALLQKCLLEIEELVSLVAGKEKHLPIVVVGGGAKLFRTMLDSSRFIIPPFADVANAYGAALAEISGCEERIVSLSQREEVLQEIREASIQKAIQNGADPTTCRLVDLQIIPYHYIPGHLARVVALSAGKG